MITIKDLQKRNNGHCELCNAPDATAAYNIPHSNDVTESAAALLTCTTCHDQLIDISTVDSNHWRFLNEAIWSEVPAVKVVAWRMLHKLKHIDWVPDLLDIAYLEEDILAWAQASGDHIDQQSIEKHVDCFGATLHNGDNVVLTKTLDVKGANFKAAVGTVVRKIRLVEDNITQIEGKVNNSQIVILTQYVKKIAQ